MNVRLFVWSTFFWCALSFAQETANVLPKHIFRVRGVVVAGLPLTHQYNNNGDKSELLARLNMSLSAGQQSAGNSSLKMLYDKLNQFEKGLGDSLFQTDVNAIGSIDFKRYVSAAEYGVTRKLTLGVIVPVVSLRVNSDFHVTSTEQSQAVLSRLHGMTPLEKGVKQFLQKLSQLDYPSVLFTSRGYQVPAPVSFTGLGDIEVGGKYQFFKDDHHAFALQTGFILPTTSHVADQSILLDQSSGNDALVYGAQFFYTFTATPNIVLGSMAKFTFPFPDHRHLALRYPGQVELPDLNDPGQFDDVSRTLGDGLDTELAFTHYWFNKSVNTYAAYQFSLKAQDVYSGGRNLDYAALQVATNSWAQRYEIGAGYSTVPAFLRKSVKVPAEVKVSFNNTFLGKNIPDAAYTRLDLYLYF